MAIPIRKFGQYVQVQVHSEGEELVFSTDSLKIDFDIRHISGWSRAKISITNLTPETVKNISTGDRYVTIRTALHDSEMTILADRMYISNALEEKQVPQSVFNMYCYSKLRKAYLEQQIDIEVTKPTVRKVIKEVLREAGYGGKHEFRHFPEEIIDYVPPKTSTKKQGSLIDVLQNMGDENRFNVYTIGSKFVFMYRPTAENVAGTDFYTSGGDIVLSTTNMRSNPKIGPATLKVSSNLDPRIIPTSVLDISHLLTLGTDTSQDALEVAERILKNSVSGFSKYQTITVQHKGSNWTGDWHTNVAATSPTPGTSVSTDKWWM